MKKCRLVTQLFIAIVFLVNFNISAFNQAQLRLLLELNCKTMQEKDLSGADLSGHIFKNVNFTKTNLDYANCNNATFIGCVFTGASICNAQFNNSQVRWTTFKGATIKKSTFDNSIIVNGNFRRADIRGSSFQNSTLRGEKGRKIGFARALLNSTNFTGSTVSDVNFRNAQIDPTTNFTNACITNACFKGTCLQGVKFRIQEEARERIMYDKEPLCPICREDYQVGLELGILPCGHRFCNECISAWLKRINSCPVCRYAPIMGYQKSLFVEVV